MTEKEIKARYKRAVFGFLWILLNPLLQMAVIGFIFSFFIDIPNYFLFLFSGLLAWQFLSVSLSKATPSIVYERALLQKAKFPIEVIPLSIVLSNFFHLLVSYLFLIIFLLLSGNAKYPDILMLIPALIWLLIFTLGLALFFSSLNVIYRDVAFIVQTILVLWFYVTPVMYSLDLVPSEFYALYSINPLTSILELFHKSFLGREDPNINILVINLIISITVLFIGIVVFKKQQKHFIDWL